MYKFDIGRLPWLRMVDMDANKNKTASFQKEAMRTQVALYFFYEVKFV